MINRTRCNLIFEIHVSKISRLFYYYFNNQLHELQNPKIPNYELISRTTTTFCTEFLHNYQS